MSEDGGVPRELPRAGAALPWRTKGVLVGVDGSPGSVAALRAAMTLARKLALPLHVIVCWDYPDLVHGGDDYPEAFEFPREDADQILRAAKTDAVGTSVPSWFTGETRRGRPARELVELSADAAVLVVGSRGRGGFAGLLMGSVSAACAAHAVCPVLVVPRPADR